MFVVGPESISEVGSTNITVSHYTGRYVVIIILYL
jgi:hypothetical protein